MVRGDGSAKVYAGGVGLGTVVGIRAVETVASHVLMESSCRGGPLGDSLGGRGGYLCRDDSTPLCDLGSLLCSRSPL